MAKVKVQDKKHKARRLLNKTIESNSAPKQISHEELLAQATQLLQQGDLETAAQLATQAFHGLDPESTESLPAYNLLGEIHVELGEIDLARQYFERAAIIDEDGAISENLGGGAEKFLWLAQLSEQGGHDSVHWFEKGAMTLRVQIQAILENKSRTIDDEATLVEKTRKLAVALCSMTEVFMTDLSWEDDAEQKCEALVTEATMVSPSFAEPWQTLANVRLSQQRIDDAKAALNRSLDVWKELPPEHPNVPEYSTRVSLARLLMEADMDTEAIDVLERLVCEDDNSVEVWYLGGWGLYIIGEKLKTGEITKDFEFENWKVSWTSSRQWLTKALLLFEQQGYEDERLGEHAKELLATLNAELGEDVMEADGEEWDEIEEQSQEDEEMLES
ncbi:hypothetical protein K3495_g6893 [Podosphaera aphanis]|nr:hypothetical protein K3495_g6893 [Podosphaera aphanis]